MKKVDKIVNMFMITVSPILWIFLIRWENWKEILVTAIVYSFFIGWLFYWLREIIDYLKR